MQKATAKRTSSGGKKNGGGIATLVAEVRVLIASARHAAASTVNTLQVLTNFEIGHRIVEHEQKGEKRAEYGAALLQDLSARLTEEFGRGFSRPNLEYMRKFYLLWQDRAPRISQKSSGKLSSPEICQKPSDKSAFSRRAVAKTIRPFTLSWSHYVLLLTIIDLKLDKLTHQDLGQMQMYVNFFDRQVRLPDENPTVGLLLCRSKKDAIVELTLPKGANIHAREYQLYLPSKELLRKKLLEWTREASS